MSLLSNADIDTLTEALQEWEKKDAMGEFVTDIAGALFLKEGDEKAKADWDAKRAEDKRKRDVAVRERKERSVLLQAKLIQMRPSAIADDVAEGLRVGQS